MLLRPYPLQAWDGEAWVGFYSQVILPKSGFLFDNYGYVANASGGFQGAWWSKKRPSFRGYPVYLQIEGSNTTGGNSRLTIKIEALSKLEAKAKGVDRIQLVRALADRIDSLPKDDILNIARPKRLRAGHWMTAAEVPLYGQGAPEDVADFLVMLDIMREFVLSLRE